METKGHKPVSRRDVLKGGSTVLLGTLLQESLGGVMLRGWAQADPKRIYIAPDDHTDYFWTAGEETYRQAFLEMIDYYLDLADTTINAGEPPEHQSRWNCDGSFWMWTYEKHKPAADFQRLINRVKSGHISVPLNALCVCLGGAPAEAVLRGMYYPGQIERRYGLRFSLAYLIENVAQPYGVYSLWVGSGAQYSWKGICNCDTRVPNAGDREHEIYWATGPDGSRMLIKWNSMLNAANNQSIGGYAEARNPAGVVEDVDTNSDFIARYPYRVIGVFGKGWDDLKTLTEQFVTVAKDKTNATRTVIVSNEVDFFQDFETTYGAGLPTLSASFGNEWELYCAALSEVSARVKRAVEKLRGAEALSTLVSLQDARFMNGRKDARDQAWMDLGLFWEHNFGMVGPPSGLINERIAWQNRLAGEIETYVDTLEEDAASALGGLIPSSGSNLRFFAFNPLGWTRTDVADLPYSDTGPFHVIDLSTGLETPSQIVTVDGERRLRVLGVDVPPVGYKVFEVRSGAGHSFADAATVSNNVISNDLYSLTVADRGAITGLVDKNRGNREFAQEINSRFINDLGPSTGSLQVENAGPVSVTLLAESSGPLSHTTRVTLLRDVNRIDIRNDINENFDDTYTWAFGFDLNAPDVWHEEVGAVIRAKLLDQGGHYSPRNARYDWLTLNHFADISGHDGAGMTLSNADCYFMKLGNSTVTELDVNTAQILPLVGGRVVTNVPWAGLPNQGGDTHFLQRFALRTHSGYNPVDAMRFALEHQNPLVTGEVTGGSASTATLFPETSFSLLTISNPNVLLWALKPADDGMDQGIIARVWNLAPGAAEFVMSFRPRRVIGAKRTTHIETPLEDATISGGALAASLAPQQLRTFALKLSQPTAPDLREKVYLPLVTRSGGGAPATTLPGTEGYRSGAHARGTLVPPGVWFNRRSLLKRLVETLLPLLRAVLG